MKKNDRSDIYAVVDKILLIGVPVLLVILWEVLSVAGVLSDSTMPAPSVIFESIIKKIQDGSLQIDIAVSMKRVFEGFIIGTVLAIIIGILISLVRLFDRATAVLVAVLRPIPIIALLPLFILWFGIDEESKIAVIALGSFWPVLVNTIQGIRQVDKKLIEVAQVLKYSRVQIILKIIIPYAFSYIFTGIRLGIGTSLACVVTAEMVAASEGLGYMIMYARMMSHPDIVFAGIFILGIIGLIIELGMLKLQENLFRY